MGTETQDTALLALATEQRWTDLPEGWAGDGVINFVFSTNQTVRRELFEERPHVVVPAVLVRSQVLHNNLGAMFLAPESITDDWANLWNGIPVLLGEHPQQSGQSISGRSSDLWDRRRVGFIFKARAEHCPTDPGVRRLVAEVWLDETRAEAVNGFPEVLAKLMTSQSVELSTGFQTHVERTPGEHAGQQYEAVMQPLAPDHLVVSAEFKGACSVNDGCGLGANQEPKVAIVENKRKLGGLLHRVAEMFGMTKEQSVLVEQEAETHEWKIRESENLENATDQDRASALHDALQAKFGSQDVRVHVSDVFSEDTHRVIFFKSTESGPEPPGSLFFSVDYSEEEDGLFTFGEVSTVRKMTRYDPAPAANAEQGQEAATQSGGAENARDEGVDDMSEQDAVAALAEQISALATKVEEVVTNQAAMKAAAESDPNPAIAGLKAQVATLAAEVRDVKGQTQPAMQELERERSTLVAQLAGNYRCQYTFEELDSKPVAELRKIESMLAPEDGAGRGGPRSDHHHSAEQRFAAPVPYFDGPKSVEKAG